MSQSDLFHPIVPFVRRWPQCGCPANAGIHERPNLADVGPALMVDGVLSKGWPDNSIM
jgi:hypothetical protein